MKKFTEALKPLIKEYNIKENEGLDSIVNECYQRLTQADINDENTILKLIGDLILFITNNKICDKQSIIIVNICEAIGVKVTQLEAELIQHQNKLVQLQEKHDQFQKENEEFKKQIDEVKNRNDNLKDRMDFNECYNCAFDLSRLFVFYHVESLLKKLELYKNNYNCWRLFKEHVSNLKREIKNGTQSPTVLQHFIEPLQQELDKMNINILHLHDLISKRHLLNHHNIRSTGEQENFITYVDEYQFSLKFIYIDLTQTMTHLLKETKLRRFAN